MFETEREDHVISAFLRSLGPWCDYIAVGGGYALIIYKLYLTDPNLNNSPVGTKDLDSLIPRKIPHVSEKNIGCYLKDSGFAQVYKDYNDPATEAYVKYIDGFEVEVEFLTDTSTRGDKSKNVLIAGVVAQPLSYLSLSLLKTITFKTYSGELGAVVSPGAWIFHKGLTFPRRNVASKVFKDLYGIWYVATQLGEFSADAVAELEILAQQNPKWYNTFCKNLTTWAASATPTDWSRLETQDPAGKLKKLSFERVLKTIIK